MLSLLQAILVVYVFLTVPLINLLFENADGSLFADLFCHFLQDILFLFFELLDLFLQNHPLKLALVQLFVDTSSIS